jgi:hypothetical protein
VNSFVIAFTASLTATLVMAIDLNCGNEVCPAALVAVMANPFQSTTTLCVAARIGAQTVIVAPMSAAAMPARSLSIDASRIEASFGVHQRRRERERKRLISSEASEPLA